jgi:hypothetical protein
VNENERISDLTPIDEVAGWGDHRKRYGWPPKELAPGVVLRRRRHSTRDAKGEIATTRTYLVPHLEDPRLFYAHMAARNARPEGERICGTCDGAGVVRYDRPINDPAFGRMAICPRWSGQRHRCVEPAPRPEPWYAR